MPASRAYDIAIADSQSVISLDEEIIRAVVEQTLAAERVASATISVAIVDNATIRELNCRHLNHDYDTDVLSFLLDCEGPEFEVNVSPFRRGEGKTLDGEIIVSAEMAMQRAAEFNWKPQDELVLYIVHGLLHLTGYDDTTDDERTVMRAREKDVLSRIDAAGQALSTKDERTTKH